MDTYKTPTPSEDFPAELPKSVEEAVIAFSHTTETPVTLFDNRATIKWEYNQKIRFVLYLTYIVHPIAFVVKVYIPL